MDQHYLTVEKIKDVWEQFPQKAIATLFNIIEEDIEEEYILFDML